MSIVRGVRLSWVTASLLFSTAAPAMAQRTHALVVAGLFSAKAPLHARLATGAYLVFFMVAGQSFNGYWGFAAWPAWALASGFGLQAVIDAAGAIAALRRQKAGGA